MSSPRRADRAAGHDRAALDRAGRRGVDGAPPARRRPRRHQAGQPRPGRRGQGSSWSTSGRRRHPSPIAHAGGTAGFRAPEMAAGATRRRVRATCSASPPRASCSCDGDAPDGWASPRWNGIDPRGATRLEAALRAGLSIDPVRRPSTPGELVERLRAGWDDRTPTGVVTVLLTDVVSSPTLWRDRPDRVPAMLAEIQLVVDRSTEAHGGRRVGERSRVTPRCPCSTDAGDALLAAVADASTTCHARPGPALIRAGSPRRGGRRRRGGPRSDRQPGGTGARTRADRRGAPVVIDGADRAIGATAGRRVARVGNHQLHGFDDADDLFAVVAPGVARRRTRRAARIPGWPRSPAGRRPLRRSGGRRRTASRRCSRPTGSWRSSERRGAARRRSVLAGAGAACLVDARPVTDGSSWYGRAPSRTGCSTKRCPPHDAVLIVDQLEELVTLCMIPRSARCSSTGSSPIRWPGRVAARRSLRRVRRLSELAAGSRPVSCCWARSPATTCLRAVLEPAAKCGLRVEDGLAD